MHGAFHRLATLVARAAGSAPAFLLAFGAVLAWVVAGFFIGFTDTTFQLAINTGTTIVTFLMVFLIQHSQNADTEAMHRKLDELILAIDGAHNEVAGIEHDDTT